MHDAFRHEVLFYAGDEGFLEGALPFLEAALETGEPTLVAVGKERTAALKDALGDCVAEVGFVDMEELGRNPARIIPFWRDFIDRCGGSDKPVRGIGEPIWPGRSKAEVDECQRHESLLNLAFGDAPAWKLLCPYDSRLLEDDVLDAALRSHPLLAGRDGDAEHPAWLPPEDSPGPFDGDLEPLPSGTRKLEFDRGALHEVRRLVSREAELRGLTTSRCSDLATAASELAANSVLHGGGRGTLAVWDEGGTLQVEVGDAGWIDEPLAGRLRPDPTQVSGRGLWLANALCDLVQIRSGPSGTRARLHIADRPLGGPCEQAP